jgi:hypothetical protein
MNETWFINNTTPGITTMGGGYYWVVVPVLILTITVGIFIYFIWWSEHK